MYLFVGGRAIASSQAVAIKPIFDVEINHNVKRIKASQSSGPSTGGWSIESEFELVSSALHFPAVGAGAAVDGVHRALPQASRIRL